MATSTGFFISPPVKQPPSAKINKVVEKIPKLILAPFNTTPEVQFGQVAVNAKCSKALLIYNPSNSYFNAHFGNIEPDDRIYTSERQLLIPPCEEKLINLIWCPIHSGYLRKTVRIYDATKPARKFDVVLRGMAASTNKTVECKKPKSKNVTCVNSAISSIARQPSRNESLDLIRRQTYTIVDKENVAPLNFHSIKMPRASSPVSHAKEFSYSSTLSDNTSSKNFSAPSFDSCDGVDPPVKYSKFESELTFGVDIFNESNPLMLRRSTFLALAENETDDKTFWSQKTHSPQKDAKPVDETGRYSDSIEKPTLNIDKTFDMNAEQNVWLTPVKTTWDSLFSPKFESDGCNLSKSKSVGHLHRIDETPVTKHEQFFISPPTRSSKRCRKSRDEFFRHLTSSSAICDRKKHVRTSHLSKKRSSPRSLCKFRDASTIEKVHTQNPQSLKLAFSSHCSIEDPFLKQVLYNEDGWAEQQERNIIRWINSVLAPPVDLSEACHDWTVDAVDLWTKKARDEESVPPLSKMPPLYSIPQTLETLRKRRKSLVSSEPIKTVFSNLTVTINRKIISIRDDRDLLADEGVKKKILELLSCYNAQWLRMGLEAVYDQEIALQPKADVGGLGLFLRKNLLAKNPIHNKSLTQKESMRKDILSKILKLIYFMDEARMQKLIRHAPCLFVANSRYKSSQEILTAFCADLVIGRGYVMKHLKNIDYNLRFKQTCVDEYDYTIKSFDDLSDGIRLARLFEILFMESNLCSKLRVPAVDIENKKHNVDVAMRAAKSRCQIEGNIAAEDIVLANRVGSRMKTLSFLWQIIHNYLTPLYERATVKIQKWWRAKRLMHTMKKFVHRRKRDSAVRIQSLWRGYVVRKRYEPVLKEMRVRSKAAFCIQRSYRAWRTMRHDRKIYRQTVEAVLFAQRIYRCRLARKRFIALKASAISLQQTFRARRKTRQCRREYLQLKNAAVCIQRVWRANAAMKKAKTRYSELRRATISVQRTYRRNKLTHSLCTRYRDLKQATVKIQRRFRANRAMKLQRNTYENLKSNVVNVQRRYRALKSMRVEMKRYVTLRQTVVTVQRLYRAKRATRLDRAVYEKLRTATVIIQRRFRANRAMRRQRTWYVSVKSSVSVVQKKYRALKAMRAERNGYVALRRAVVALQRRYRANKMAKRDRTEYERLRKSVVTIQRRWRANRAMRQHRTTYLILKSNVLMVQKKYKARNAMRMERKRYVALRQAAVTIQRRYRANKATRLARTEYENMRKATDSIQRWYRSASLTKKQRAKFSQMKRATIKIQRWYRRKRLANEDRWRFEKMKSAAIVIQRRYRARRAMLQCRLYYSTLRAVVIAIQRRFVAVRRLKSSKLYNYCASRYETVGQLARLNVSPLRKEQENGGGDGFVHTMRCRLDFLFLKMAAICIQRRFKANSQKAWYAKLKRSAITIQTIWRMKLARRRMLEQKRRLKDEAATKIQAVWRGYSARKKVVLPAAKRSMLSKQAKKEDIAESKGTLSERYKKAINVLKTSDEYDKITIALWNLETVTTFSAKLCQGVTEEGVLHIIFDLISRANRSVPSMELYRAGFSVLINLARYPPTKAALWQNMIKEEYVAQILRIMKMNFDKVLQKTESEVFLHSVTFLWLLCHDSNVAAEIVRIDGTAQQIQKMLQILKTKCPCSKNRKKKLVHLMPESVTDWYADRTTRTFNDHCFAMQNVHFCLFSNNSAANII